MFKFLKFKTQIEKDREKYPEYDVLKGILNIVKDHPNVFQMSFNDNYTENYTYTIYANEDATGFVQNIALKITYSMALLKDEGGFLQPIKSNVPESLKDLFYEACYKFTKEYADMTEEKQRLETFKAQLIKVESMKNNSQSAIVFKDDTDTYVRKMSRKILIGDEPEEETGKSDDVESRRFEF